MLNNVKNILIVIAFVGIIVLAFMFTPKKEYNWDIHSKNVHNTQPYSFELLDGLLERSLDNGYEIKKVSNSQDNIEIRNEEEHPYIRSIANAPIDTTLFLIYRYPMAVGDDEQIEAKPIKSLFEFAKRGGKALYVSEETSTLNKMTIAYALAYLEAVDAIEYYDVDAYSGSSPYSKDWLRDKGSYEQVLEADHETVKVDGKFTVNKFIYDPDLLKEYNHDHYPHIQIKPLLTQESYYYDSNITAYALDVCYPETGGHLILTPLNLFFCNLGVAIPNGPEVIEFLMSKVDDQPVARLEYREQTKKKAESVDKSPLSVVGRNPALTLAWTLILVFMACLLLSGLMRKHPPVKPSEDELDKTDIIAVRNHKFKSSPLLHFLYQCSWLYNRKSDYRELFDVNFRRLARVVKKHMDVELNNATRNALIPVAEYFATLQDRSKDDVLDDLLWMVSVNDTLGDVGQTQFRYSQKIAETFDA